MDPDDVDFRIKILTTHKSAFERQIREAVLIEHFAGPLLLNSKMEYNRCSIPKIVMKLGNRENGEDPKITEEKSAIELIKLRYKGENKRERDGQTEIETIETMDF